MAGLTLHDVIIPSFTKGLKAYDHVLSKAEEYAKAKGLDADSEFADARLIEDQNPLVFQIQNGTKQIKSALDRLSGKTSQPFENTEKSFADLRRRLQAASEFIKAVDPEAINSGADRLVTIPFAGKEINLSAKDAALSHSLPNFFFHLTTAYSILRAKGVPLGKADYIGSFLAAA